MSTLFCFERQPEIWSCSTERLLLLVAIRETLFNTFVLCFFLFLFSVCFFSCLNKGLLVAEVFLSGELTGTFLSPVSLLSGEVVMQRTPVPDSLSR